VAVPKVLLPRGREHAGEAPRGEDDVDGRTRQGLEERVDAGVVEGHQRLGGHDHSSGPAFDLRAQPIPRAAVGITPTLHPWDPGAEQAVERELLGGHVVA
jgi:hypothetical protein